MAILAPISFISYPGWSLLTGKIVHVAMLSLLEPRFTVCPPVSAAPQLSPPQNSGSAPPASPQLQKLEPPVFFPSPPSFPQPIITITTIVSHPLPPEPISSPSNHNGLKRFLQVPARSSPVGCAPCAAALLHRRQTARPRRHCCSSRCRPCRSAGSWCQDHGLCRSQGGCLW